MAAALIPIAAIAGSAVDMARIHVVKVRLQQACDAGVLAGRKFMPDGTAANVNLVNASVPSTNTTPDQNGKTLAADGQQALSYFNNNIETSWLGANWFTASTDQFTANTIADNQQATQVAGTATAQVPMTLMSMFGFKSQQVGVSCQASTTTPDTDVMFVLDTTGSMGCAVTRSEASCGKDWAGQPANQGSAKNPDGSTTYYVQEEMSGGTNISRIDSLRQAVIAFYNQVAKTKDPSTNIRYGFVPYTSSVNVGPLLYAAGAGNLVSKWSYQSRIAVADYHTTQSASATKTVAASDATSCAAKSSRNPAARYDVNTGDAHAGYPNNGTATSYEATWAAGSNGAQGTCTLSTWTVGPHWSYQPSVQYDVSQLLKNGAMPNPSRVDSGTTTWNGCIEERDTAAGVLFPSSTTPTPPDLDPNLIPSSDSTRWRPMWSDVVYNRQATTWGNYQLDDNSNLSKYLASYNDPNGYFFSPGLESCPAAAKLLFLPADKDSGLATITNYVNSLHALGGTYLDVGMIWGARMLSPSGVFQTNNAWQTGRAEPHRMLIFVTDGSMAPGSGIYGAYASEYPDRRVTGTVFAGADPSGGTDSDGNCTNTSANCYSYANYHTQRLLAECAIAKAAPLQYDIWVVEVAQANTLASATALQTCASRPSQVLVGKDPASLTAAFTQIARQVALLRITQ